MRRLLAFAPVVLHSKTRPPFLASPLFPSLATRFSSTMSDETIGATTTLPEFGQPDFGMTKTLPGVTYQDAIDKATAELKKNGFGILTTIDVAATMKTKLNTEFTRPYMILGACNPKFARKALMGAPTVGLLMPCNVVVTTNEEGDAIVSIMDPIVMFSTLTGMDVPGMKEMAGEVQEILQKALDEL